MFVICGQMAQKETRDRDHPQVLVHRRSRPRAHQVVEQVALVDEAEGHELREASGLLLDLADQIKVGRDVSRLLDVAVHQRRRRAKADAVGSLDDLDPAVGLQLVRRELVADLVVEDLRRRPGHRPESRLDEPGEVFSELHPALLVSKVHFLGRVGVDVEVGIDRFDRAQDVAIGVVVLTGVDAALDADLGRTALDRVLALPEDLFVTAVEGFVLVAVAREAAK